GADPVIRTSTTARSNTLNRALQTGPGSSRIERTRTRRARRATPGTDSRPRPAPDRPVASHDEAVGPGAPGRPSRRSRGRACREALIRHLSGRPQARKSPNTRPGVLNVRARSRESRYDASRPSILPNTHRAGIETYAARDGPPPVRSVHGERSNR